MISDPVHRSIVAVDIEGYSRRNNSGQSELRAALRQVLADAFQAAGITPDRHQDQGDMKLILIRPEVPKTRLLDDLVRQLGNALQQFNRYRTAEGRMRLRASLHAGEVHLDGTGYPGEAVVTAARLLNARPLRMALRKTPKDLALIVSDKLYQEVIRHEYPGIDPASYRAVRVAEKEFRQQAWIHVPGHLVPPLPEADEAAEEPDEADRSPHRASGVRIQDSMHGALFLGPTSFGGHAAGRDVNAR
ncbi:hypothetical protein [Carbonactinospora thermoautotrophica]|uniref:hypothetical protein n=1 Tax=Carbonactinospora thermoautotrophica TaxID=1469144 RepID=UPI00082C303C|nr:hypothetical protein [Carbonactinospora thermoautotrophica]